MGLVADLTFIRKLKEQGNKDRAQSWRGLWGLADRIPCISGDAEHVHEHGRSVC